MGLYLGIDGGGTGCRALLADESGRRLGHGRAGAANINSDCDGAIVSILAATTQAVNEYFAETGCTACLDDVTAVLGLAGANVSEPLEKALSQLPFGRVEIVSDGLTATRGALGLADGIVAAIGTGSVFSLQRQGVFRQIGGRGFMLGDEGSGAVLGRELLADALRADDGVISMTPLLAEVLEEWGGSEAVIRRSFKASPGEYATLAPRIAVSADPAAIAVKMRAWDMVRGMIAALQPKDFPLPVVFIGGLGPLYGQLAQSLWETKPALGTALDGAVALAFELGRR